MHLVVDGYGGNIAKIESESFVHEFLDAYPANIGMTKITDPHVFTYHAPCPEDWGVSGFVIIAESHISIHTFPARRYINIDVFSCRDFDGQKALKEIEEAFELDQARSWILPRGIEYSDPKVAFREVNAQRALLTETGRH